VCVVTVPLQAHALLFDWQLPPVAGAALVGVGCAYAWGVDRLRRRGRAWPVARSAAFTGGLAVLTVALCSGIAHYDTTNFSMHMVQHLLLSMVGPPLLALGAPVTLALQASSRTTQRRLIAALHSPAVTLVTHPLVTWALMGATLVALYFSPLYGLTLRHAWLHDLVHLHLIVVGVLFVWPVVALDPVRWRLPHGARMLYVLTALPFHSVVGLVLTSSTAALWAAHTLSDQQTGGGVMMLGGDLVTVVIFTVVFFQWAATEERAAARANV
jgi:putative copper resistance protein D